MTELRAPQGALNFSSVTSAYGCEAALRRLSPTATMAAPSNASSHAGKPVNGSSPGLLGSAERVVDTPLTCFSSSFCRPGLVGGVEAPAAPLVVVVGVLVEVVGVLVVPFAVAVVVVLLLPLVVVGTVVDVTVDVVVLLDVVVLVEVVVVVVVEDDVSAQ
jgi:hypothetical protein